MPCTINHIPMYMHAYMCMYICVWGPQGRTAPIISNMHNLEAAIFHFKFFAAAAGAAACHTQHLASKKNHKASQQIKTLKFKF